MRIAKNAAAATPQTEQSGPRATPQRFAHATERPFINYSEPRAKSSRASAEFRLWEHTIEFRDEMRKRGKLAKDL